jgi:hypothetical protein
MDLASIAKLSSSIAETGTKQDVGIAVLKRAQQIESAVGAQMVEAINAVPSVQNLPPNLGNKINTTA